MIRRLILFLLVLQGHAVMASHMSGGEIFWECIGPNQYRITMKIYRDCAGIAVDPAYNLQVTSPCGNTNLVVTTPGGVEISQLCDIELPNSTCNGGTLPGIQEYIYTGIITLPPCDSWTISYTNIYRNAAIVNLQNPAAQRTYIRAEINTADAPCNDSPQFTNTAIPYVCLGMPYTYSFGVFDPEADSVSYQFIPAMGLNGNPLSYVPPYSATEPIPGITLDPATGEVNFTLNQLGNWVVNVQVDHWLNGQVVGTVMRDMQFVAYPCDNIPPDPTTGVVSGLSGAAVQTGPRTINVCESGSFCFDLTISDANAANVLSAFSNIEQNLPGATFSYTGTNPIVGTVCWTAAPGTSGFFPFIVNVNDGACPIYAFQTYVYTVQVIPGLFGELTGTEATCSGQGTLTANVTVGTGPYNYQWSNGSTSPTITADPGDYSVVISDAAGCVSQPLAGTIGASLDVPVALAGPDLATCGAGVPVQLNGSVINATSGSWSGGSGSFSDNGPDPIYTPSADDILAGSITLTFTTTGSAPCPEDSDALVLSFDLPFPEASVIGSDVLCSGGSTGTASVSVTGTGMSFLWNDPAAQTTATVVGLTAGTYQVTVTDPAGCDTTMSVTIDEPADVIILDMGGNPEWCAGDGTGEAYVTASGGTPPYSYQWSTGATTPSIPVTSGTFSVVVVDANACQSSQGVLVLGDSDQPATVDAGADLEVCASLSPVQLIGTATAMSTSWSGGGGTFSGNAPSTTYFPSPADLQAGSVTLTLTGVNGGACPAAQDAVTINFVNALADASVTSTNVLCNGEGNGTASVVMATGGLTYQWNDPAAQTTATATGLSGGTYEVVVTDALGCDTTLSVTIEEPASVIILDISGNAEICAGDGSGSASVTATGGTSPYNYLWSNGSTDQTITVTSGMHTVIVSDQNGCQSMPGQIDLGTSDTMPMVNAGSDIATCADTNSVQLQATANAITTSWSGGTGTFSGSPLYAVYHPSEADVLAGGVTLTLTGVNEGDCPAAQDQITISFLDSFADATVIGTDVLCNGDANGTATVLGLNDAITFQWNDPEGQTTASATGLQGGVYTVLLTDTLGCQAIMSVTIEEPASVIILEMGGNAELCAGDGSGVATVTASGGVPPYNYLWSNGATDQSIPATSGVLSVLVGDANGCLSLEGTIDLGESASPAMASAGPDITVCDQGNPVPLSGSVVNATGAGWSGGAGSFLGVGLNVSYLPTIAEFQSGGVDLVLTTTGNGACPSVSDTLHLHLSNALIDAGLTVTHVACNGAGNGSIVFSPASAGLTYQWTVPGAPSLPDIGGLAPGIYGVVVTDALGCDTSLSASITEPTPLAIPPADVLDVSCAGAMNGAVSLTISGGTPGYTVSWNGAQGGPTLSGIGPGTYTAVVTDANGCTDQTVAVVAGPAPIFITADVPDTVCVNAPVMLTAQSTGGAGGYQYTWGPLGQGSTVQASFQTSQSVTVTVTDQAGCQGPTLTLPITVLDLSMASLAAYGDTTVCPGGMATFGAVLSGYPGSVSYAWPELGAGGQGPFTVPVSGNTVLHVYVTDACGNTLTEDVQLQLESIPSVQIPPVIAQGCAPLTVNFPPIDLPAGSIYQWDLGNGNSSSAPQPVVDYGAGIHDVSLTVITPNGCINGYVGTGQVIVHGPPSVEFSASPWTTDIDDAQVAFTSQSPDDLVTFGWTFGDGGTANGSDPVHTFTEIGTFDVVLWVTDANGCTASVEHPVTITPVYDIVLPNAFTPNGSGGNGGTWNPGDLNNDVFYPFVRFVDDFKMRVFNRWGELVFESNDVTIGWDGYYRGQLSPQDVYVVQTYVRFVDGKEVQQLSDLTLFR